MPVTGSPLSWLNVSVGSEPKMRPSAPARSCSPHNTPVSLPARHSPATMGHMEAYQPRQDVDELLRDVELVGGAARSSLPAGFHSTRVPVAAEDVERADDREPGGRGGRDGLHKRLPGGILGAQRHRHRSPNEAASKRACGLRRRVGFAFARGKVSVWRSAGKNGSWPTLMPRDAGNGKNGSGRLGRRGDRQSALVLCNSYIRAHSHCWFFLFLSAHQHTRDKASLTSAKCVGCF